ncbi:MAG: UDP-N-acetylglucosamine 2-epimerase (hydrolyzing) [Bacteroidetes bacterium]|nr:UDP-N-acetylglucosamine 2-epimerase (hydrolyzing) [Bacteroidota bacterium]
MRKICVFIGSRANYSSIKSVMKAVQDHPKLKLQVVAGASALLERFGKIENLIVKDGFTIDYKFYNIVEGENPTTMAKSTGLGIIEMAMVLDNLKPYFVVVVGDRFEMMAVTIAAAYMNIRVVHTMGGEVTGTIDESIRHAISKFAHVHFPANDDARQRIIRLGEDEKYVFNVGCPRIDLVAEELQKDSYDFLFNGSDIFKTYKGVGKYFDLRKPFLLVSQHPVTTEFGNSRLQIEQTLSALNELKMPTIILWPNVDAGSDEVSKGIRTFREKNDATWIHAFINLPTRVYIHLMNVTSCLIGNSSSGIREGAFIGTPVVNIGTRQSRRMQADNVLNVGNESQEIISVIKKQLEKGKYPQSLIYGNGTAGEKIVEILTDVNPPLQKHIAY